MRLLSVQIIVMICFSLFAGGASYAEELTFAPSGMFVGPQSNTTYKTHASWSSDLRLQIPGKDSVDFSGPIFPGYKIAKVGDTHVDVEKSQVIYTQHLQEFKVDVTKTLTERNGSVLNLIQYQTDQSFDQDVMYRIFFPLDSFAGKQIVCNGKPITLPIEKGKNYTLYTGSEPLELRVNLDENTQFGIKLISGFKSYTINDCRFHGKPENHFHLYIKLDGTEFQYQVSLLSPTQPFPSLEPSKTQHDEQAQIPHQHINLLGQGAGFEVGPVRLNPYAYYSWSESYSDPATQQPTFDDQQHIEGNYSLRLQADDIKKHRGRFNINAVMFKRVRLDPSKTYTLSAWLKSDSDMNATMECAENIWEGTGGKTVRVTDQWQRYSYTFQPTKYKLLNDAMSWIGIHPSVTSGMLWVDAVQLEEGNHATDYAAQPIEFGAQIKKKYKLFTLDQYQNAYMSWSFRNNTDKVWTSVIQYQIRDYWDNVVYDNTQTQSIASNANLNMQVPLPPLPIGYYRVKLIDQDNKDCRDEAIFGIYQPVKLQGKMPLSWPLGCDAAEGDPIVRDLGFGWTRDWQFRFKRILPEPDKTDFTLTDIIVDRCERAGINLMPVLGTGFGRNQWEKDGSDSIPDWAIDEIRPSSVSKRFDEVYFPRIDAWKQYIRTVVGRYKGRIKAWEILNEPNCWISAEEYAPYLKATYEAANEVDPDCIIVGGCATSDWNGDPAPWTKKVIDLLKGQYMDVLSIHMYSHQAPEDYMDQGANVFLEELKKMLAKYDRNIPIWHTEKSHNTTSVGYTEDKHGLTPLYLDEPMFRVNDFRDKAEFLIRETLIDYAVGKGPFFWFGNMPNDLFISSHRKAFGLQHIEYDNSPTPELIAANGMARLLQGRNLPVGLRQLSAHVYAAMYEGPKGVLVAIWDAKDKSLIQINDFSLTFETYQFFGVRKPLTANHEIELGTSPSYMVFVNASVDQVSDWLIKLQTSGKQFSVSGGLEMENDQLVLAAYVRNLTSNALKPTLKITEFPAGWQLSKYSLTLASPGLTYTRFVFPVMTHVNTSQPAVFKVTCNGHSTTLSFPFISSSMNFETFLKANGQTHATAMRNSHIKIDGDLRDWQGGLFNVISVPENISSGREYWQDPSDTSAMTSFAWDDQYLYVAAHVFDDVLERNCEISKGYASDCFEFFLGTSVKNHRQFFMAPATNNHQYNQAQAWCKELKSDAGIKIQSSKTQNGYDLEIAIPWANVLADFTPQFGKKLIMSFQVCDVDTQGRPTETRMNWESGNWQKPELWGNLILK